MAKENRFWFDHDYGARNDDKILELRAEFGAEGYGVFWMLIETLADSETATINTNLIGGLAHSYGVAKNKLSEIINFCISIGLLLEETGLLSSKRVKNHKNYRSEVSQKNSNAAKKKWEEWRKNNDATAERPQCDRNASGLPLVCETDAHDITYTEHNTVNTAQPPEKMTEKEFLEYSAKLKDDGLFTQPLFSSGVRPEHLGKWILHYHVHIVGEGKINKDYAEYRRHFKNWLKKQDYLSPPPNISPLDNIRNISSGAAPLRKINNSQ